jgi:NADPH:quinone reductase-like Zn-dependent oxidoreductase
LGCYVTVSCSTGKATLCKALGADEIIDYKTTDVTEALEKAGHTYSHVVDNAGNPNLYSSSSAFLLPEAKYVFVGSTMSLRSAAILASSLLRPAALNGSKNKFVMYVTKNQHDDLVQIAQWLGEGKLKTVVDSCFEFADVAKAFAQLKKGTSAGKVVVHVAPRE